MVHQVQEGKVMKVALALKVCFGGFGMLHKVRP